MQRLTLTLCSCNAFFATIYNTSYLPSEQRYRLMTYLYLQEGQYVHVVIEIYWLLWNVCLKAFKWLFGKNHTKEAVPAFI